MAGAVCVCIWVVVDWWVVVALGKCEFGLYGMFGGMAMIVLLAFAMRLFRGSDAAAGCSSMGGGAPWQGKLLR